MLRLLIIYLVYFQPGYGFLLDDESDRVCNVLELQQNISLSALIEHEIGVCSSINNHFQNMNAELLLHKDSLLHLVKDNMALQQTVQTQTTNIADLKSRLAKLEQDSNQHPKQVVAFSTLLTTNQGTVKEGFKIKFDDVLVNTGNGYNVTSGIFTAPIGGAYHFSMSMASPTIAHFFLMKNGQNVEYTFTGGAQTWESTSQSAVMDLVSGDQVWVEADGPVHGYIGYIRSGHPDHRYLHTGFMGFLIH